MAAVTQNIPSFLGGISTQQDTKKTPGQLADSINAYPDPTFGLNKRPGLKYLRQLVPNTNSNKYQDAKWFVINRDNDEVYLCAIHHEHTKTHDGISIWNLRSTSVNNFPTVTITSETTTGENIHPYLNASGSGLKPSESYEVVTIQDTTFIVNKNTTVQEQPAPPSYVANQWATVRIKTVDYSAKYKIRLDGTWYTYDSRNGDDTTSSLSSHTDALDAEEILSGLSALLPSTYDVYQTSNTLEIFKSSGDIKVQARGGKGGKALEAFVTKVDSISDLPDESVQGRKVKVAPLNANSLAYWAEFETEENTAQSIGKGSWIECRDPAVSPGLDGSTMPIELKNTTANAFTIQTIKEINDPTTSGWTGRLVGDLKTNSSPSFVGKKISNVFFHNNRLGFLSGDNVILSQSGEYFNFYHITASALSDADPIDVSTSSVRPVNLTSALPAPQGVLLFSKDQQYVLYSESGNLTPKDSLINGISAYEMDTKIKPADTGRFLCFASKSEAYTRVFSFQPRETGLPDVVEIGKIIHTYIPANIQHMVTSTQNNMVGFYGTDDTSEESGRNIYFFKNFNDGEKNAMQSWFKWRLPGRIYHVELINDRIYAIVETCGFISALTANLTSSPIDKLVTTNSGKVITPYIDFYTFPSAITYTNGVNKCTVPYNWDCEPYRNLTPVVMLAAENTSYSGQGANPAYNPMGSEDIPLNNDDGSGSSSSSTSQVGSGTQTPNNRAGTFVTPTVTQENGVWYWSFKDVDYSDPANHQKVIIGYRFDFEVVLPTMYYQIQPEGKAPDYSASLVISRMKFSLGESNAFDFEITAAGKDKYTKVESNIRADYYLANDITIEDSVVADIPIYQRTENFTLKLTSDKPLPLSLQSLKWEGIYSPRYYRRT